MQFSCGNFHSLFIDYTDNNKKDFTSQANWFDYDEFVDMLNKMNWISHVRLNQGKNAILQMSISDFKKFPNNTFDMHFNNNGKNDTNGKSENKNENENENEKNNNNNNSNNNMKTMIKIITIQIQNRIKKNQSGNHQHNFDNMNNKNNKKKSKQSTIMASMGARLKEMASEANTNDIHHPIKRPMIKLPSASCQKLSLFFSDNYGFSKYKFYNPIIKDFNISIMGNFANIYRAKIDPNKQNFARDFKNAVVRSPIGKTSIFIKGNLFIPFKSIYTFQMRNRRSCSIRLVANTQTFVLNCTD